MFGAVAGEVPGGALGPDRDRRDQARLAHDHLVVLDEALGAWCCLGQPEHVLVAAEPVRDVERPAQVQAILAGDERALDAAPLTRRGPLATAAMGRHALGAENFEE
jgi:hypothetical protein